MKNSTLLIIGGSTVKKDQDKNYFTKGTFYSYLMGLNKHCKKLIWIVPNSYLNNVQKKIEQDEIQIISYQHTVYGILLITIKLLTLLIRNKNISCIMFPSLYLFFTAYLIKMFTKKFISYLGVDYIVSLNQNHSTFKAFLIKLCYEIPLKLSDSILVRGKRLKEITKHLSENIYLSAPIGTVQDIKKLTNFKKKKSLHILYVGKLIKEKGIDDLFLAYELIRKKIPENMVFLDIVGDGLMLKKLKTRINYNVTFHGWVDDIDVMKKLYKKASVLTFLSTENYPEGLPRVIEEAQSFGVPVCSTNILSVRKEFSKKNIKFFISGQPETLSKAVIEIYKNKIVTDELVENGFKRLRNRYKMNADEQHINLFKN